MAKNERFATKILILLFQFQIQAHKAGMRTVFPKPEVILRQDVSFWPRGRSIVFALAVPLMPANEELLSVFKLEVSWGRGTLTSAV